MSGAHTLESVNPCCRAHIAGSSSLLYSSPSGQWFMPSHTKLDDTQNSVSCLWNNKRESEIKVIYYATIVQCEFFFHIRTNRNKKMFNIYYSLHFCNMKMPKIREINNFYHIFFFICRIKKNLFFWKKFSSILTNLIALISFSGACDACKRRILL